MGCAFFGFWLGLDSLIFAALGVVFLAAAPWYLLRRMAERHRQKIEDQLADAMVMLGQRGSRRPVTGPVDGDPGLAVPEADQCRVPPDRGGIQIGQAVGSAH